MSSLFHQIPIFIFFLLCSEKIISFLARLGKWENIQETGEDQILKSFIEISQKRTN